MSTSPAGAGDGGLARRVDVRPVPGEDGRPEAGVLDPVVRHVRRGGLVAYPTETVYGLGGLAEGPAVEALQRLKGRSGDRPFLILVPAPEAVPELAWTPAARELAEVFWPGALTLVLGDPEGRFPPGVRSPRGSVGVRVSPHPVARALLEAVGRPLTSTSANAPGEPAARSGEEVVAALRRLGAGREVWVLDGGPLPPSPPSTLVDCTEDPPRVRRAGAVPAQRLQCVRPEIHGSDT